MSTDRRRRTLPVSVQWSWPRGMDGTTKGSLRITDEESSATLVEIEFSSEDVTHLLSSMGVNAEAQIPSRAVLGRIGKRMETERIPHPQELTAGHYESEPSAEMAAFAEERKQVDGWDTVAWSRHNYGWALTGRRWVEITDTPERDSDA